jgi:hypothetical protein
MAPLFQTSTLWIGFPASAAGLSHGVGLDLCRRHCPGVGVNLYPSAIGIERNAALPIERVTLLSPNLLARFALPISIGKLSL